MSVVFFFQAEDGIRDSSVTGVQTCALPIWSGTSSPRPAPGTEPPGRPSGSRTPPPRSEERRVGEEGRSRWAPDHLKKLGDKKQHQRHGGFRLSQKCEGSHGGVCD